MTRRYYHPDLPPVAGTITLGASESLHAIKVMRVKIGDPIELFDGRGNAAAATVLAISRRDCQCQAEASVAVDREPATLLELGIALPKPDRAKEMIERLTELGVKSVTPLTTSRTQRPPAAKLLDKLRRASIEACKQSGRNVLLEICDPASSIDFFSDSDSGAVRWIAHPNGTSMTTTALGDHVIAAIGPEGGWTDDEVSAATEQGFHAIGLGQRIFRVETAAAFVAARLLN